MGGIPQPAPLARTLVIIHCLILHCLSLIFYVLIASSTIASSSIVSSNHLITHCLIQNMHSNMQNLGLFECTNVHSKHVSMFPVLVAVQMTDGEVM